MGHEGERQTCEECGQEFDAADLRQSLYHLTHRDDVPECLDAEGQPIRGVLLTTVAPFSSGAPAEHRGPTTPEHVDQCLEVLRAMWVLIAVRQRDAVADDVQRFGGRLKAAREVQDWAACREVLADAHQWTQTMGGVVAARMTAFWVRIGG